MNKEDGIRFTHLSRLRLDYNNLKRECEQAIAKLDLVCAEAGRFKSLAEERFILLNKIQAAVELQNGECHRMDEKDRATEEFRSFFLRLKKLFLLIK